MLLLAQDVTAGYAPCPILQNFSLAVPLGQFLAVAGPNGSPHLILRSPAIRSESMGGGQHDLAAGADTGAGW